MAKEPKLNFKAGSRIRANVKCTVNASEVRHEQRDGRDVIVVPSFTLPDNVVMNGILYPAEEIEASYKTLEGTPAPLGHPTVNSMFVPAASALGLNIGYFGAWNANVTRVEGRVFVEKLIDVKRAQESEMGRRVLAALDGGKPIHTSTGLLMNIRECRDSDLADYEGFDMEFDHDAILLDQDGAATPDQGVGMLVNGKELTVVNSSLAEEAGRNIDYLGMELLSAFSREEAVGRWARMKEAIMDMISSGGEKESQPKKLKEAMNMDYTKEDITQMAKDMGVDALIASVNTLTETVGDLAKTTAKNSEVVDQINDERKATADALVAEAVELKLLNEADAKATPANVLQTLINSAKKTEEPTPAPGIFGAFNKAGDTMSLGEDWEK